MFSAVKRMMPLSFSLQQKTSTSSNAGTPAQGNQRHHLKDTVLPGHIL